MISILYLDDELASRNKEETREIMVDAFESLKDLVNDFELFLFDNYGDFFDKLKECGNNTIVILDLQMPKMNGDEVLEKIRNDGKTCSVIIYSAKKGTPDNDKFLKPLLENDAFDYVQKAESEGFVDLVDSIKKAIKKMKDNVPLEIGEALSEYISRRPKRKDMLIEFENRIIKLEDLEKEMNANTNIGKTYQKNIYKLAIELFSKKE